MSAAATKQQNGKFLVWREDDHGIRIIVRSGIHDYNRACEAVSNLTRNATHKQEYYVALDNQYTRDMLGLRE